MKEQNKPVFLFSKYRSILRDSGLAFDITKCAGIQSLREYVVAQTLALPEHKFYISTTGYNRNEFLLGFRNDSESL